MEGGKKKKRKKERKLMDTDFFFNLKISISTNIQVAQQTSSKEICRKLY